MTRTSATTKRRAARSAWPIQVHRLDDQPGDDLSAITTAEERLAMMWTLAVEAWGLARHSLPDYSRAEAPVRYYRRPVAGAES
ncbi:MAG: hypothetical protein ACE5HV_11110 [Acidobacteriota bacterium]